MRTILMVLAFVAGLTMLVLGGASAPEEPIQPTLRLNLDEISVSRGSLVSYRSAKGELVFINQGGPEGWAMASSDEGRTWYDWPEIHTWPRGGINAVARRGKELLIQVITLAPDNMMSIWRSQNEGKTWTGGELLLDLPIRVDKKLLWFMPTDQILITRAGRLLVPVDFLLGVEGLGPELIGSLVSEDNGQTWRLYKLFGPPPGYPDRPEGFSEPKLVELADGRIWMVFRTCLGHLWQSFSSDGGLTWDQPTSTGLVSPAAPLDAARVPNSDAVVIVWENGTPAPSMDGKAEQNFWSPRTPLVFAVSHDNCKTWSRPVIISKNNCHMHNIYFSDTEMFMSFHEAGAAILAAYDLKTVLSLRPEK